jgi:hypothetical protein
MKDDVEQEIKQMIQKTPLVSMRPIYAEWRELMDYSGSLLYVDSSKEGLRQKLLSYMTQNIPSQQSKEEKKYGYMIQDILDHIGEVDTSYL